MPHGEAGVERRGDTGLPFGEIQVAGDTLRTLMSCHSVWLFDDERMRFCRIPRGTAPDVPMPREAWTGYHRLEVDATSGVFVVSLDERGTKMLRSRVHQAPCPHCDPEDHTGELALGSTSRDALDAPGV